MTRLERAEGFCESCLLPKRESYFWRTFVICFLLGLALLGPFWLIDGGIFRYAGDFNFQQIPFYQYANSFVKAGGSFSWVTDLGSGFVNSYSFYLLGSPFFWLSCLFPARVMPYLMVPFLCLKFAVAGSGGYLWLRRYTKTGQMALIGGVLYAFSGFNVYNVFFNHFLDVTALFPFLLWALDEALHEDRRGIFPLMVALNLLNSYFFFAGQVLFLFLYFGAKVLTGSVRIDRKQFAFLAFESLLGCALGCLLAYPAVLSLMNNPRTIRMEDGYGLLFYDKVQQYFAILYSLFLPPDPPYMYNLFHEGLLRWTSMSGYLPLVGCVGGIAWIRGRKKHPFTKLLLACLVCAFVPVLNSAFYLLNSSYYARWWYMPVLILCAVTVIGLEQNGVGLDYAGAIRVSWVMLAVSMAFALVPAKNEDEVWTLGVVEDQARYWAWLAVALLSALLLEWLLWKYLGREKLAPMLLAGILVCTLLYGWPHAAVTKFDQWDNDSRFVAQCYEQGPQLGAELKALAGEGEFFRTDSYKSYDNLGLWTDVPCLRFFNSTVAPSILEFYPSVGVTRDVNSKPDYDLYALRGLLSVKYLVMPQDKQGDWNEEKVEGYTYLTDSGEYAVYQNDNYLPMGFAYDYYITQEQADELPKKTAANTLLKALVLDEGQIARYGTILEPLPETELNRRGYQDYCDTVKAKREACCSEFTAQSNGFTAAITLEQPRLVLFTVPWESGFTATVNNWISPVEKVSNGLMAIRCPAGESRIAVTYRTPGLRASTIVTALAALVYLVYFIYITKNKRRPQWISQSKSPKN